VTSPKPYQINSSVVLPPARPQAPATNPATVSWPLYSSTVARSVDTDRLPPLRILVVDDDAPIRNACSEIANSLGFATQSADSVSTARLALQHSSIDILLLDLKIPGGGGPPPPPYLNTFIYNNLS
jgi:hypothetical protein